VRLKLVLDEIGAFQKYFREISEHLCHTGSDFQKKLRRYRAGDTPHEDDGYLAVVKLDGEIVGWARSERWEENPACSWDTLEAFVSPQLRNRGLATLAVSALTAGPLYGSGNIAVFHPHMLLVARRAGVYPQLFERKNVQRWERV
jgi:hypothetical protein